MQPDPAARMRYPCPYCHAPADLDAGCTACGRPPDTEAAGVIRLDATIWALTAVAWANFGVIGRAAILAAVTVLTLAVGPLASMRRLTGTAETFAALGLLLVLLDGYAAWSVNLAGLAHGTRPAVYAAGVCAV